MRIDSDNPVVRDSVFPEEVQETDGSALCKRDWSSVNRFGITDGGVVRTIPTGPKPIRAMFNTSLGKVADSPAGLSARVGRGYGFPFSKGASFGCCKSWRAAKYPVGRISARRSRELSARVARREPVVGFSSISFKQKRVPPAQGTRTYWACPPSKAGEPKRRE